MNSPGKVYKVEGVILKCRNSGEADRILTVLTREYGKIKVIGKGVRKIPSRRAGHLEVFTHVFLTLHKGRSLDIVTEATSIPNSESGRDLRKVSYAYYLCELVDALLPEHQEHRDIFALLTQSLARISESSEDEDRFEEVTAFALETLWILGFLPRSQELTFPAIQRFIERIIERKLRTVALLTKEEPEE